MDWTTDRLRIVAPRVLPWLVAGLFPVAAIPVGLTRGTPAVVLLGALAALVSAAYFLGQSVRLAVDPLAPGDDLAPGHDDGLPAELVARKRAAMRGLQDVDFEHSIGRLGAADHERLKAQYRAEARAALLAIDEGLGSYLTKADALLAKVEKDEQLARTSTPAAPVSIEHPAPASTTRTCPSCHTRNDGDAVFCKKCATRLVEAADA